MKFDIEKFKKTKFAPGTEDVPVPTLAAFFTGLKENEIPVWKIRGLSGIEMGNCNESAERNKKIGAILEGVVSTSDKETAKAVKDLVGAGDDVPQDIAGRIERFVLGSVAPEVPKDMAVKICKVYPAQFFHLTNRIMVLSGLGYVPGKPPGSGKKRK